MRTSTNVAANVAGRVWSSLMSFAFVPFYIRLLGAEAYGLIGFFTALLATFFVLDLGLSTSINRDLARLSAAENGVATARVHLRSFESIYWPVGAALGLAVALGAPFIARHWLNIDRMAVEEATDAIRLMGLVIVLRWPVTLYTGALMGLRRHVRLNLVNGIAALVQGGGAVLALILVDRSIETFFRWQVAAAALQVVALYLGTWQALRLPDHRARPSVAALRDTFAFSAGVTGISLLSVLLTQLDKFVLARLLPLEQFGYYTLAGAIAGTFVTAGGAFYGGIFPSFTQLVAGQRLEALSALYHRCCQALAVVLAPAALTLVCFAPELLALYAGDSGIAVRTQLVLRLLVIGNLLLAFMMPPLGLQLAFGWTRLSLVKNVVAVAVFVPTLILMVGRFGAVGAAITWNLLTIGYFLVEVQVMHRRLLRGEQWRWYFGDIAPPVIAALAVLVPVRWLLNVPPSPIETLLVIGIAYALAQVMAVLASPTTRAAIVDVNGLFRRRIGRA